jgi:ABC-type lipoprotein export system ATPase subunit
VPSEPSRRPSLVLEGVSRRYRRGQEEVHALREASIALYPGELTLVLGPSGGGKSTFLHLLGGMDRPDAGRVLAHGRDISTLSADGLSAYRRGEVGFVFQAFHLLAGRTALENVELPLVLSGKGASERRRRALALLERVGLGDRRDHRPAALSGGQAQRVAIARAIAAGPDVLLADEPTGALDRHSGREVLRVFQELNDALGLTIVMVTHEAFVARHARRIVELEDGRIIADRPVEDRVQAEPDSAGVAR